MHSSEIDCFYKKAILSEPSSMQACQSSKARPNTSTTFANFLGHNATMYCMITSRKREQNICYVIIMWCSPLPSKSKKLFLTISLRSQQELIFLKLCLNVTFMMCKYCRFRTLLYFFAKKFVSFDWGLKNHFNFVC